MNEVLAPKSSDLCCMPLIKVSGLLQGKLGLLGRKDLAYRGREAISHSNHREGGKGGDD